MWMCTRYALVSGAATADAESSRLFVLKASFSALASRPSLKLDTAAADLQAISILNNTNLEHMGDDRAKPGALDCN